MRREQIKGLLISFIGTHSVPTLEPPVPFWHFGVEHSFSFSFSLLYNMRTTPSFQSKKGIHDIPATSPISIIGSADYTQNLKTGYKYTHFFNFLLFFNPVISLRGSDQLNRNLALSLRSGNRLSACRSGIAISLLGRCRLSTCRRNFAISPRSEDRLSRDLAINPRSEDRLSRDQREDTISSRGRIRLSRDLAISPRSEDRLSRDQREDAISSRGRIRLSRHLAIGLRNRDQRSRKKEKKGLLSASGAEIN
jgi:hypothetical protein